MFGWFKWFKRPVVIVPNDLEDDYDYVEKVVPTPNPNLRNGMWVVTPDARVGILTNSIDGEVTHTDAQGQNIMEVLDGKFVIKRTYHAPVELRQARLDELPNRPMMDHSELSTKGYM